MSSKQNKSRRSTVPSLAALASQAVEEHLNNVRDKIPDEAEDRVADRRRRLHAELAALSDEKQEYINERMAELALERELALEHMNVASAKTNQYCTKCKKFYIEDESKCSVPGCVHSCSVKSYDDEEDEDSDYKPYECWFENNVMEELDNRKKDKNAESSFCLDYISYDGEDSHVYNEPSQSGYTKCWICALPFCNHDFEKHYDKCRARASIR